MSVLKDVIFIVNKNNVYNFYVSFKLTVRTQECPESLVAFALPLLLSNPVPRQYLLVHLYLISIFLNPSSLRS